MSNSNYQSEHGRVLRKFIIMAKKTNRKGSYSASKKTVSSESHSTDGKKVVWCFDMIDRSGKFAFDLEREEFQHKEFMQKMVDYSSMTWSEVKRQTHDNGKSKHHFLSEDSLSKEALVRMQSRQLGEYSDSIFSFALQNKLRIVGIREDEHFHVLWYDPEHEICPSKKKNT